MTTPDTAPDATPAVPQPTQGGSYVLDPATGALTRVAYSRTAEEAAAEAQAPATDQPE